jgi:protein-disulfide isomerase
VLARIGSDSVTAAEVDGRASTSLASLRQKEYEARRGALDAIVSEKLLAHEAAARGMTVQALVEQEVTKKVPSPTDAEVEAFYQQVANQVGGRTKEQIAPQLRTALLERAVEARRRTFERELRKKAGVQLLLAPPRTALDLPSGAPQTGAAKAPVTIVEYLDYQCPYCMRAQTTVDTLLKQYAGKVRLVHRDFPIEGHPRAMAAARATRCAGDQGKFWEYHQSLFARPSALTDDDLRTRATELKLDAGSFVTCMSSNRHDEDIHSSYDSGIRAGVGSTPTFFINGRMLEGARPLEDFQEVVEEELEGGAGSHGR